MAGMVSSSTDPSQHQMLTTASTVGTVTTAISVLNTTAMTTNSTIRDENLALIEVATLGTLFVLIVFGNCCVLLALALRPLKMTRMYYYLLHLCISDLITGFFTVLPQLAWDITYRFNGGNILCKMIKCTQILGPYLSSYVLVVTAIDRYQAICFPLSNCSWTPRRSKLMIACAWLISIVCSAPQAFIFSYQEIPHLTGVYDCWGTFPQPFGERIYVTWYAVSVFFVPLAVLVFTHFYICREIWVNVSLKRKTDKNREKQFNDYNNSKQLTANGQPISYGSAGGPPTATDARYKSLSKSRRCLLISFDRVYRLAARRPPTAAADSYGTQSSLNNDTQCTDCTPGAVGPDAGDDSAAGGGRTPDNRPKHCVITFKESMHNSSPRVNTVNRLSRAKIKTVKITVVVILCYITCSSPFIFVQLWAYWVPSAQNSDFWAGPIITILMLLSSLNSFVNPFIYLFFNQNLVKSLLHYCCRIKLNDEFIINKTNASELNSNYNYGENRGDTQSSTEDTTNRVNRNGDTIAMNCHDFGADNDTNQNQSSKSRDKTFGRNRRLNIRRKNDKSDNFC